MGDIAGGIGQHERIVCGSERFTAYTLFQAIPMYNEAAKLFYYRYIYIYLYAINYIILYLLRQYTVCILYEVLYTTKHWSGFL